MKNLNSDLVKNENKKGEWERVISSPIRWAGSKSSLLNDLLSTFERNKKCYIEPFLGSGAVLINVLNNSAKLGYSHYYVNDSNENIIGFYRELKNRPKKFIVALSEIVDKYNRLPLIEEKETMFYKIRELFNDGVNKNVYFYFLMKTCFNGVYRENSKGLFNVPFGRKTKVLCDKEKLIQISKLIKKVDFYCCDYFDFFEKLKKMNVIDDSLVYCDPPYIPDDDSVYKTQTLYSKPLFKHEKFFDDICEICSEDCKVIISMSESNKANEIYDNYPLHKEEIRQLFRIVNPKIKFSSKEIIFTNI